MLKLHDSIETNTQMPTTLTITPMLTARALLLEVEKEFENKLVPIILNREQVLELYSALEDWLLNTGDNDDWLLIE